MMMFTMLMGMMTDDDEDGYDDVHDVDGDDG